MAKYKTINNPSFSIPSDIIPLILVRLPAIALQRFKTVCKSWLTLITSPKFVNLHFHYCNSLSKNRLLIISCKHYQSLHSISLDSQESPAINISYYLNKFHCQSIIGSCNGLILCTCIDTLNLFLINPSTMEFRIIPQFQALIKDQILGFNYGFGYDCSANDYKVVVIFYCDRPISSQVMVYSLRNKSWKLVEETILPNRERCNTMSCNQNGKLVDNHLLHWVFWYPSLKEHKIVSFDVCSEQWDVVPIPDYIESRRVSLNRCYDMVDLGVLNGCLCLVTKKYGGTYINEVNVWIMKEYGVKDSWMKLFDYPDLGVTRFLRVAPIAYSSDGNKILLKENSYLTFRAFWYNFREKKATNFNFQGGRYYDQVHVCIQSLVPLPS